LLKPLDTLARISGDQFGLVLVSEQDAVKVAALAEAISKAISAPIDFAGQDIRLTASIGLVTWVESDAQPEDLIKDAELAMYQAKRFGGNRIEPFRPAFRTVGSDRQRLESDLRRALERKELTLVYQPIVELKDAEIAGFEALLRWEDPKRGTVPPSEFIPVAETSDLILELGMYSLKRAADDLAIWQETIGEVPVFMSVNLSSAQLLKSDLCNDVIKAISASRCDPSRFRLELTESLVMHNPQQALMTLSRLSEAGIGLTLDDFGTGHSSLAYLTRFPFQTIKIDKSLVIDQTEKGGVLIRSIVNLAKHLDMSVVAEGVASERRRDQALGDGLRLRPELPVRTADWQESVQKLLKERFPVAKPN
jgi:predicted signal transduction protein with EAL and GGDEF domain